MLELDTRNGTTTLTLARSERGNALSAELVEALIMAARNAFGDEAVHTLVLRAQGRNFCTGLDLADIAQLSDGDLLQRVVRIETLLAMMWRAPIRTMVCASGRTWGAGADLFATCDLRVAADDATFRFPGARFGLVLGTRRLAERIGADLARRCTIEGLSLDAAEAQRAGLVNERLGVDAATWRPSAAAPVVDRRTMAQLRAATRIDMDAADMAALVRSASAPGLKQRVERYRASAAGMVPKGTLADALDAQR